jgi:hypothetical protein
MSAPRDDWDEDERAALEGVRDELVSLRARHAGDPPLELLRAARGEALPPELQASVGGHLSESAWSRALVDGLEGAGEPLDPASQARLLARVQKDSRQQGKSVASAGWLRPAFAAAALAASVAVVVWSNRPGPVAPPSAAPPQTTLVAVTPTHAPPSLLLPLEKPAVKLSAAALTWRRGAGEGSLLADLEPALEAYGRNDYATAERELTRVSSRYPRAVEVFFYQGVTRLFLDDVWGAIASLKAAEGVADSSFAPDVAWYRAVAEQRAGNLKEAQARLDSLCRGTSPRAAPACEALELLDSGTAPAKTK